jgi:hypothetical protein
MSKGNYYGGSPLGSRLSDDGGIDRFMAVAVPWFLIGVLGIGVYGFYKIFMKNDFYQKEQTTTEQTITPKDIINYQNTKTL